MPKAGKKLYPDMLILFGLNLYYIKEIREVNSQTDLLFQQKDPWQENATITTCPSEFPSNKEYNPEMDKTLNPMNVVENFKGSKLVLAEISSLNNSQFGQDINYFQFIAIEGQKTEFTVGRSQADVQIQDNTVSSIQFLIKWHEDQWILEDRSKFGTFYGLKTKTQLMRKEKSDVVFLENEMTLAIYQYLFEISIN